MQNNKAYEFCKKCIDLETTPNYVKKQMQLFMDICEDKNEKFILNKKKVKQIEDILKILIMPKGLKSRNTII